MKLAGLFAMASLSLTQFETRHRMLQAELEREHAEAADRRVVRLERARSLRHPRRWLRAVRGTAAA